MRILGISPFHDSSICLFNEGKIELFLKEERITKIKRDELPFLSVIFVEQYCRANNLQIDIICIASPTDDNINIGTFKSFLNKLFHKPIEVYHEQHHLTHASLAFYNSGFTQSLVFVIDRNGSVIDNTMREAETIFKASYPCEFETLHKNFWKFNSGSYDNSIIDKLSEMKSLPYTFNVDSNMSIVKVYESATTLIGQMPLENGKTMGLASYGNTIVDTLFVGGRPIDGKFVHGYYHYKQDTSTLNIQHIDKVVDKVNEDDYKFYADYAYTVQQQTQDIVLDMIQEWVNKTGITNVCLTGGYALNVVSNGNLIKNLPNVNFYFEPLADDSGNSIGVCQHFYRKHSKDTTVNKLIHTFIHGLPIPLNKVGNICNETYISAKLADGKVVAVFNGLSESGPRALGNRSILFDPRNTNGKNIINNIKKREWYRPFAAIVLKEKFKDYFKEPGVEYSDFMCVSFECKSPELIPAVVHVDNSCRVQTCDETIPHMFKLLTQFKQQTGCAVLLNTSFNLAGEPLVETQNDAINTFYNSDIDLLWFPELETCLEK
jgi:carbamoyltransferase